MQEDASQRNGDSDNGYSAALTNRPQVQPNPQLATGAQTNTGGQQPAATGQTQPTDWQSMFGNQSNWTADNINNYAKSRGVDNPNFADYWLGKGNELYQRGTEINNPNYAFMRLSMADDFGGPTYGGPAAGTDGPGGGAYVPGQGVPGMGTIFGGGGPTGNQYGNDYFNQLMARSKQSLNIDPNDPIIANSTNQYRANADRGAKDIMTQAAERGGPNANTSATQASALEKAAQGTAGYQAQLMDNERTARRQEIQSALQGMGGMLSDTQRAQLQEELAQLQLGQGAYQFDTNMQFMNSPLYGGG